MKESEVLDLGSRCGYPSNRALPLKNEASGREYWRLSATGFSCILCYLDPAYGGHQKFETIANIFQAHQINSPKILHHASDLGVLIQEDLGDLDLLVALTRDNSKLLTFQSLDVLAAIHSIEPIDIPKLTLEGLRGEMELFCTIFCNQFLGLPDNLSLQSLIMHTSEQLTHQPWVNCHYDFERRNLMLSSSGQIHVIDFQDLCKGPIGIDLAGILVDHYLPADKSFISLAMEHFSSLVTSNQNIAYGYEIVRWGAIQRNMRILGVLARLFLEQDRDFRLKDMPMILSNLIAMVPSDVDCRDYMIAEIQPRLIQRLSAL